MTEHKEENNYPKSFLATGLLVGLLMAACYLIVIKAPAPEESGTGGILVNYGTTNEGMGSDYMSTEEPSVAEHANHTKPDKVTPPQPTEQKVQADNSAKSVVTQNTEDAPEVAKETKKPTNNVATQPTKKVAAPTVNQNALYKGKSNNGTGEGDGTGNKPGNQGNPNGSTLTDNYNGNGSGNGGNLSMAQRTFVTRPHVDDNTRVTGVIIIEIQVDKQGNIINAGAGRGTTISDYNLIQKCINAVKQARINSSDTAPDTQLGNVKFVFKAK
ncbi:hypothetical protein C8P68_107194 [Mucilaginibacter yixingensis]|uniref:Outer membrane transport energization protein TonB n=1 Tax=Mucilaginibacter yixingensis TaxID=1295612 RepID=A0A2T5J6K2_9SPHI|nr:energy transducer TonB [Mucilaginibacter yixingensis]PTQ94129.1 hypothetical protein C8P68_107194 [Mucilaginibacter yixingensis]